MTTRTAIFFLLFGTAPVFGQGVPRPVDITEGRGIANASPRQELGITSSIRIGDRGGRGAAGMLGAQWSFLLASSRFVDVQYVLEGRPFVLIAQEGRQSTNGWSVNPAGLRVLVRNRLYAETSAGLLRTRLTDTERVTDVSQYHRTWEIGAGVQFGRATGPTARVGYKYMRVWNSGQSTHDFTANMISVGVVFPFRR